jgi:hypothetical protein
MHAVHRSQSPPVTKPTARSSAIIATVGWPHSGRAGSLGALLLRAGACSGAVRPITRPPSTSSLTSLCRVADPRLWPLCLCQTLSQLTTAQGSPWAVAPRADGTRRGREGPGPAASHQAPAPSFRPIPLSTAAATGSRAGAAPSCRGTRGGRTLQSGGCRSGGTPRMCSLFGGLGVGFGVFEAFQGVGVFGRLGVWVSVWGFAGGSRPV